MSPSFVAAVLLSTVLLAPSLGLAAGASSMTAGTLLSAGLLVVFALALFLVRGPMEVQSRGFAAVGFAAVALGVHTLVCQMLSPAFDRQRALLSSLMLLALVLGGLVASILVETLTDEDLGAAAWMTLGGLLFMIVVALAGFSPFFRLEVNAKPVLFYSEPSHFALNFLPLLLFAAVVGRKTIKFWLVLIGIASSLVLQNVTLLVGAILVAIVTLPLRPIIIMVGILAVALGLTGSEVLEYFGSRVDLSADSTNLSVLAFLQGWERSLLNFRESLGLGVGFQQFGIVGSRGEIQEAIAKLGMEDMNLFDGTTVASKIVAEFGVFGLAVLGVYVAAALRAGRLLRRVSVDGLGGARRRDVLAMSVLAMYSIDLFVRGVGYFSSSSLLLASSLWTISSGRSARVTQSERLDAEPRREATKAANPGSLETES